MLSKPGGMIHYNSDCGHYAKVWRIGNYLWFHITWLSHYDSGAVKGFEQMFSVPVRAIRRLLTSGGNAKLLCSPVHTSALIKTSPSATATIRNLTHNKRVRRAFSKAMRDCFNWSGDCVTLYRDGGYNFYFTTRSGIPKCGGLILHEIEKDGYRYIYYSVHT